MLNIVVLGGAAGGGLPQWNCNCAICRIAWDNPALRDTQTSLAVSADGRNWFLINASPDIRQQILDTPQLHPRAGTMRDSPIAGVILTNGEVDAVAGLLSLREGTSFGIYAHERVLHILDENSIFHVLDPRLVPRRALEPGKVFEPLLPDGTPSGLRIEPFEVPGKPAWYLEGARRGDRDAPGDTLGLHLGTADCEGFHFVAACGEVTEELASRLRGSRLVFFDGTLWRDDELVEAGLGTKTGRRMGHVSMSGEDGAIRSLSMLEPGRKIFIHVNNSNPAHLPGSAERRALEAAGWDVAAAGWKVTL